jgi:hypothetical protein
MTTAPDADEYNMGSKQLASKHSSGSKYVSILIKDFFAVMILLLMYVWRAQLVSTVSNKINSFIKWDLVIQ